jgi:hypothetical protein
MFYLYKHASLLCLMVAKKVLQHWARETIHKTSFKSYPKNLSAQRQTYGRCIYVGRKFSVRNFVNTLSPFPNKTNCMNSVNKRNCVSVKKLLSSSLTVGQKALIVCPCQAFPGQYLRAKQKPT